MAIRASGERPLRARTSWSKLANRPYFAGKTFCGYPARIRLSSSSPTWSEKCSSISGEVTRNSWFSRKCWLYLMYFIATRQLS
jgi:hypothetical protein